MTSALTAFGHKGNWGDEKLQNSRRPGSRSCLEWLSEQGDLTWLIQGAAEQRLACGWSTFRLECALKHTMSERRRATSSDHTNSSAQRKRHEAQCERVS